MTKKSKLNMVKEFIKKHPILFNLALIVVTACILVNCILFAIDNFTGHGEYEVVPELKGMTEREVVEVLKSKSFKYEITDSTYNNNFGPGCVVDQEPKANSRVKPLRTIYLNINAVSPRTIAMPMIIDMSCRQGKAMLEGVGFKNIRIDTIASPYKDLIVGVSADGKSVESGRRLSVNTSIVILVGSGVGEVPMDTVSEDIIDDMLIIDEDF